MGDDDLIKELEAFEYRPHDTNGTNDSTVRRFRALGLNDFIPELWFGNPTTGERKTDPTTFDYSQDRVYIQFDKRGAPKPEPEPEEPLGWHYITIPED